MRAYRTTEQSADLAVERLEDDARFDAREGRIDWVDPQVGSRMDWLPGCVLNPDGKGTGGGAFGWCDAHQVEHRSTRCDARGDSRHDGDGDGDAEEEHATTTGDLIRAVSRR